MRVFRIICKWCGWKQGWIPYKQFPLENKRTKCFKCGRSFYAFKNMKNHQVIDFNVNPQEKVKILREAYEYGIKKGGQ